MMSVNILPRGVGERIQTDLIPCGFSTRQVWVLEAAAGGMSNEL